MSAMMMSFGNNGLHADDVAQPLCMLDCFQTDGIGNFDHSLNKDTSPISSLCLGDAGNI